MSNHPSNLPIKWTLLFCVAVGLCACAHKKTRATLPHQQSNLESYSLDDLLIQHEGLQLKPYMDSSNKLTIGVGRNLDDTGISRDEALLLLHNDINRVETGLDKTIPWWRNLSENRQKVLVSMAFNLGLDGLMRFNRMLAALQDGDYSAAAEEMLASKWAAQVGVRAVELADMMENG